MHAFPLNSQAVVPVSPWLWWHCHYSGQAAPTGWEDGVLNSLHSLSLGAQ
jgi:hypothetical protein